MFAAFYFGQPYFGDAVNVTVTPPAPYNPHSDVAVAV